MATLTWHQAGMRYYETGVSRGVFYPSSGPGVPWNGLISVVEGVSGGEHEGLYLDGIKYAETQAKEEFVAQIEAYSAPAGFSSHEGQPEIAPGLFATKQQRMPFGMAYRSQLGNDILGSEYGYKIHLIYNAMVAPAEFESRTIGESLDPNILQWDIYATPLASNLVMNPAAHWFIDSRLVDPEQLIALEDILYGTSETDPQLPSLDALVELLQSTP